MATTFSVGSGDYIRPYRNVTIKHFPVTISQTIKRGDAVKLAGAGLENRIKIGVVTETSGYVGIAAEDITTTGTHNAATDKIAVWQATESAEFIGLRRLPTTPSAEPTAAVERIQNSAVRISL